MVIVGAEWRRVVFQEQRSRSEIDLLAILSDRAEAKPLG